jgi:hypothetical protein
MDTCEEWMKDSTAKCLYWGLILVVLLLVLYDLRNQVNEIYQNPHWIDKMGSSFSPSNLDNAAHGVAPEDIAERFQDPDWINGIGGNFSPSNLDNAAHGAAPEDIAERFKLPPGSERFGVPGPSWEGLLNIDEFSNRSGRASDGRESDPLKAALGGGSAINAPQGSFGM